MVEGFSRGYVWGMNYYILEGLNYGFIGNVEVYIYIYIYTSKN